MKKKLLSILLAVALLIATLPLSAITVSAESYSGTCGDNLVWTFDELTGTLSINGSGYMTDWGSSNSNNLPPWYSYNLSIVNVNLDDRLQSIGDYAFYGCGNLNYVEIGKEISKIGHSAFHSTGLTEITIPGNVASIGAYAFSNCRSLLDITIEEGVTTIGSDAFNTCISFTDITIPSSIDSIGYDAFYDCRKLSAVYITDIVKWCQISFGGGHCNPLYYASKLYLNGVLVEDLILPYDVKSIGRLAFHDCNSLISVTIPDSVTSIGGSAFNGCNNLEKVTIGTGVKEIGQVAFLNCPKLAKVYISDIAKWCQIDFSGQNANALYYAEELYVNYVPVNDLVIPNGVETIKKSAFANFKGLKSVTIPNSVTTIEATAFSLCSNLTSLTMGNCVTTIGGSAFTSCTNLERVYITDVSKWCQMDIENLYANPLYYAKELYVNNALANDLIIPEGNEVISSYVFGGFKGLKSVIIPDSVKKIGLQSFINCSNLETAIVGSGVSYIDGGAFKNCNNLTLTVIEDSYTHKYAVNNGIKYKFPECVHINTEVIFTPTHTERGIKNLVCELCGEVQSTEYFGYALCDINKDGLVNEDDLDIYNNNEIPDDFDVAVLDFDSDGEQSTFDTQIFTRLVNGIDMDVMADANGDGKTSLADMLRIKKMLADSAVSGNADFNGTGGVDADDLAFAKRFLLMVR